MTATAKAPSDGDSLGRKTGRGILQTLGGQWARTLLQLASTVVLARLLVPEDFGLLAMVTAIVGIAEVVRDFGLTAAILQLKTISDRLWSMVFWLSALLGTVCTIVIAVLAPLIAGLYGEPRLIEITLVLAPSLLLNSMSMPFQTRLQRQLNFGKIAIVDVVSMAVGVVLAIAAGFLGWGVWSLVVLNGAGIVARFVGLWIAARPPIGAPRLGRELLRVLGSSANLFGSEMLGYLTKNLDNVVVGRFAGPAVLGFYGRAYSLLLLPLTQINGPLTRVALPVLSSLQDDPERYRRYIYNALMVISYASLTVFAIGAAVADPLIHIFLGPGWSESVPIFQLLAIGGVAQSLDTARTWLYISLRRTGRQLIYVLCTRPIVIASFVVGMLWGGVNGLVLLSGVIMLVLLVPGFYFAIQGTFVRASDVVMPFVRPVLLAPFMFAAAWAVQQPLHLLPIVELMIGGLAGLVPLALAFVIVPPVRRDVRLLADFARKIRAKP